jgi:hypothetical protein
MNGKLGTCLLNFYPVGDSLVGITHGVIRNIYTLRWLSIITPSGYAGLKNDGLGYADFF